MAIKNVALGKQKIAAMMTVLPHLVLNGGPELHRLRRVFSFLIKDLADNRAVMLALVATDRLGVVVSR